MNTRKKASAILAVVMVFVLCAMPLIAGAAPLVDSIDLITPGASTPFLGGNNESGYPSVSADGTKVVFSSAATNLISPATTGVQVFLYNASTDVTTLISKDGSGNPANGASQFPVISTDGTKIAFQSTATNLAGAPANGNANIFVCDANGSDIRLVSAGFAGTGGDAASRTPSINADGTTIAFVSQASNLVGLLAGGENNIFLWNAVGPTTMLVTTGVGGAGTPGGNGASLNPSVSGDGTRVVFDSTATNLTAPAANGMRNIFLWNQGTTTLVTTGTGAGNGGSGASNPAVISRDGSTIAFQSEASNIVSPATSGVNIYRYVISGAVTTLVTPNADNQSHQPSISGDGKLIAFSSFASNLVTPPVDTHGGTISNGYVYDATDGTTALVTKNTAGNGADGMSTQMMISADGNAIAFRSMATDLVDAPANGQRNVFLAHLGEKEPAQTVTVTFDPKNGKAPVSTVIPVNTPVAEPLPPTKAGYTFAGWYTTGGVKWNFNDPVPADMTLIAHWTPVGNGGNGGNGGTDIPPTGDALSVLSTLNVIILGCFGIVLSAYRRRLF